MFLEVSNTGQGISVLRNGIIGTRKLERGRLEDWLFGSVKNDGYYPESG